MNHRLFVALMLGFTVAMPTQAQQFCRTVEQQISIPRIDQMPNLPG
jgi:hypothetical protein